jgi:pimeloyl-ACP methyl ester carboxylesterase
MTSTWDEWRARAETFESGGLAVAGYDLGDPTGPVATFLHGFPSSSLDVEPVVGHLEGWRTVALDFPGFGASAKPAGHRYSIRACADAVQALWAAKGVTATFLLAHDYGVSVGQELVARHLDGGLGVAIGGIVWMNGGLYPDLHRPTAGQQMLLDPEHGAELAAAVTEEMFCDGLAVTWGTRHPADGDLFHEIWRSMDDGGGVPLMHDLLGYVADRREHEARWRTALESSGLPAAFVWGDLDPVSGAHMVERVESRVPGGRVVRLADVGHWPPLEAPAEVAAALVALAG